jgi:hypothetical protein
MSERDGTIFRGWLLDVFAHAEAAKLATHEQTTRRALWRYSMVGISASLVAHKHLGR